MAEAVLTTKSDSKSSTPTNTAKETNNASPEKSFFEYILELHQTIGNQAVQQMIKDGNLQLKSSRVQPGDAYNREVDRLAKRVETNFTPVTQTSGNPVQRAVEKADLDLWNSENNQTIPLDSGSKETEKDSVDYTYGEKDVHIGISEFALNHFCNRHTIKEFSFKPANIKNVNSFWPPGTTVDNVLDYAKTVIIGVEDQINEAVDDFKGAAYSKLQTVGDLTVGYKLGVTCEDDSYDEDTGEYKKWKGQMEMFYPEDKDYKYYSPGDLNEIRDTLQQSPYNKVLQLTRRAPETRDLHYPSIPIQMKAGVEYFNVKWNYSKEAKPTHEKFEIDFSAKFKDDEEHNPNDAEFRQNAGDRSVINEGPHKGDSDFEGESPLEDDGYSRAADPETYFGAYFEADDEPGIEGLDPDDDLDYEFFAEQMIIDTSDNNKIIAKKDLHTVTIKGKAPRAYSGLPHSS